MSLYEQLKRVLFIIIFLHFSQPLFESMYHQYSSIFIPRTQVGLLTIKGVLYDSTYYIRHLNKFFKNKNIKAILIKMDCPGSAAGTGQAIHNELKALKKQYSNKTVIVLAENLCASGGYYIASAADYIVTPGMALVGSIGVDLPYLFQLKDFMQDYKIYYQAIRAGKHKNATNPFVLLTEEEKAHLQTVIDDSYQQFIRDVATNRSLSPSKAPEWADGKIFSAQQALKLGLVDEIGSAYAAEKALREKALIEDEIEWIRPPQKSRFSSWLVGEQEEQDKSFMTSLAEQIVCVIEQKFLTPR